MRNFLHANWWKFIKLFFATNQKFLEDNKLPLLVHVAKVFQQLQYFLCFPSKLSKVGENIFLCQASNIFCRMLNNNNGWYFRVYQAFRLNLSKSSEMITLGSLLTTFEVSNIFCQTVSISKLVYVPYERSLNCLPEEIRPEQLIPDPYQWNQEITSLVSVKPIPIYMS